MVFDRRCRSFIAYSVRDNLGQWRGPQADMRKRDQSLRRVPTQCGFKAEGQRFWGGVHNIHEAKADALDRATRGNIGLGNENPERRNAVVLREMSDQAECACRVAAPTMCVVDRAVAERAHATRASSTTGERRRLLLMAADGQLRSRPAALLRVRPSPAPP